MEVSPTVHEILAHLPFQISRQGNRGLKRLSEENLEGLHKVS